MKKRLFFTLCLGLLFLFPGCSSASKPDGFPKTVPCTVKVVDGGKPVPDVSVSLMSSTSLGGVIVSGTTNGSGVATIRSLQAAYSQDGAPEGDYTVRLTYAVKVDMPPMTPDEEVNQTPEQHAAREKEYAAKLKAGQIIPEALSSATGTPLTLTVTPGANLDIDLAAYR